MTNFERIKAMTVDEMATFLEGITNPHCECSYCFVREICFEVDGGCETVFAKWLESEVQEND